MPQKVAEADQVHGTFSHDSQVWFDFIYIERERVSVYYLLHVILVKNFQLLLTTQWPPQHTGLEDLCNAFLGNPFLASTPMGLAEGGIHRNALARKISQELSVKRTICLNLEAA